MSAYLFQIYRVRTRVGDGDCGEGVGWGLSVVAAAAAVAGSPSGNPSGREGTLGHCDASRRRDNNRAGARPG
jgi:hypothetical protein